MSARLKRAIVVLAPSVLVAVSLAIFWQGGMRDPFRRLLKEDVLLLVLAPTVLAVLWLEFALVCVWLVRRDRLGRLEGAYMLVCAVVGFLSCVLSVELYLNQFWGCASPWAVRLWGLDVPMR